MSDDVAEFGVCPKCGGGLHFQVNLFIDAPATRFGSLSKATLRSKNVQVLGAGWDRVSWYCPKGDWASRLAALPQGGRRE